MHCLLKSLNALILNTGVHQCNNLLLLYFASLSDHAKDHVLCKLIERAEERAGHNGDGDEISHDFLVMAVDLLQDFADHIVLLSYYRHSHKRVN